MFGKVVYIAHPYRANSVEGVRRNIQRAEEFGKQVALKGGIPLIPHNNTRLWDLDSRFDTWSPRDWVSKICLPLLRRCDILFLCGNWKRSKGCLMELEEAQKLGIDVVISKDGISK